MEAFERPAHSRNWVIRWLLRGLTLCGQISHTPCSPSCFRMCMSFAACKRLICVRERCARRSCQSWVLALGIAWISEWAFVANGAGEGCGGIVSTSVCRAASGTTVSAGITLDGRGCGLLEPSGAGLSSIESRNSSSGVINGH